MTRTPKFLSRHFLTKILTCVAIAGTIAVAFHPLQAGLAKSKPEADRAETNGVETPVDEDPALMQWWNEDINAPDQPLPAPKKPSGKTDTQPSVFMERNQPPVKHRFELPAPAPAETKPTPKIQPAQPNARKPQPAPTAKPRVNTKPETIPVKSQSPTNQSTKPVAIPQPVLPVPQDKSVRQLPENTGQPTSQPKTQAKPVQTKPTFTQILPMPPETKLPQPAPSSQPLSPTPASASPEPHSIKQRRAAPQPTVQQKKPAFQPIPTPKPADSETLKPQPEARSAKKSKRKQQATEPLNDPSQSVPTAIQATPAKTPVEPAKSEPVKPEKRKKKSKHAPKEALPKADGTKSPQTPLDAPNAIQPEPKREEAQPKPVQQKKRKSEQHAPEASKPVSTDSQKAQPQMTPAKAQPEAKPDLKAEKKRQKKNKKAKQPVKSDTPLNEKRIEAAPNPSATDTKPVSESKNKPLVPSQRSIEADKAKTRAKAKAKKQKQHPAEVSPAAVQTPKRPVIQGIQPIFQANPAIAGVATSIETTGSPLPVTKTDKQPNKTQSRVEKRQKSHNKPGLPASTQATAPALIQQAANKSDPIAPEPSPSLSNRKRDKKEKKRTDHRPSGPEILVFPKPVTLPAAPSATPLIVDETKTKPEQAIKAHKKPKKEKKQKAEKVRHEKAQMAPQIQAFPSAKAPAHGKPTKSAQPKNVSQPDSSAKPTPDAATQLPQEPTLRKTATDQSQVPSETRSEKKHKKEKKRREKAAKIAKPTPQRTSSPAIDKTVSSESTSLAPGAAKNPMVQAIENKTAPLKQAEAKPAQKPTKVKKQKKSKKPKESPPIEASKKPEPKQSKDIQPAPSVTQSPGTEAPLITQPGQNVAKNGTETGKSAQHTEKRAKKKKKRKDKQRENATAPTLTQVPAGQAKATDTTAKTSIAKAQHSPLNTVKPEPAKPASKPERLEKPKKQKKEKKQTLKAPQTKTTLPKPQTDTVPGPSARLTATTTTIKEVSSPSKTPDIAKINVPKQPAQPERRVKKQKKSRNKQPVTLTNQPATQPTHTETAPQPTLAGSLLPSPTTGKGTTDLAQANTKTRTETAKTDASTVSPRQERMAKKKKKAKAQQPSELPTLQATPAHPNGPTAPALAITSSAQPENKAIEAKTTQPSHKKNSRKEKRKKEKSETPKPQAMTKPEAAPLKTSQSPQETNTVAPQAAQSVPDSVPTAPPEQPAVASNSPIAPVTEPVPVSPIPQPTPQDSPSQTMPPAMNPTDAVTPPAAPVESVTLTPEPMGSPQQKAAAYAAAFKQWQQSTRPQRFDSVLDKGQEAASTILKAIDTLDEAGFEALHEQMPGYLMLRNELIVVAPDPAYFKDLMKKHGTPVDIAFFDLMSDTLNGYWPTTMEQRRDFSGCTRFGSQDLVGLYGRWTGFQKRYPGAYRQALQDPNLPLLSDIEDQLLNSKAACDGPSSVVEELKSFVTQYPTSPLAPKIRKRLQDLQQSQFDMVFYQGVKYNLEH